MPATDPLGPATAGATITVTPRLSESPLFRTKTSIHRNGGVSLFFEDLAIPKSLLGKPLHSENPPTPNGHNQKGNGGCAFILFPLWVQTDHVAAKQAYFVLMT